MSHITEGLLHAHLDGAIGHDRAQEWLLAEAHLGDCEDCRRRLEEARQVRGAAGEILALATVHAGRKPNFEELLRQAGGGSRPPRSTRWWSSTPRLAWAASLMLAAGAGWLGRELLIQTGQDVPAVVAESEALPQAPELTTAFSDAPEADEAAAGDGQFRAGADDADMVSGERAAGQKMEQPAAEPAVAAMQKNVEEVRQDAAPIDANRDRLAAVEKPAREREAVARLSEDVASAATCYVADTDLELQRSVAAADESVTPDALRLEGDGTAVATVGDTQLSGTWSESSTDSIQVVVANGEAGMELQLERTDTGFTGTAGRLDRGGAADDLNVAKAPVRLSTMECEVPR
jgi:hypothetical protein